METLGRTPPAALLRASDSILRVSLPELAQSVDEVLGASSYPACQIVTQCFAQGSLSRDRRLARVAVHLFGSIDRPLNLSAAASLAGVESHYFSSYFRRKAGVTYSR
jgi:hypothetical protein